MPAGKGTYGSKVGRPPEKKKKAPKRKAMTSLTKMTTVPFKKLEVRKLKKVKLKHNPPLPATTRETALSVYKKQMEGKPLVGWEKGYSKSGSYKAFVKTKPYGESGRKKRGETLVKPAEEKAKRMRKAGMLKGLPKSSLPKFKIPPGMRPDVSVK